MDAILQRIFEIEEKAQNIVEDVKQESAAFETHIAEGCDEMRKKLEAKTEEKIAFIRSREAERTEAEVNAAKEVLQQRMERLDHEYEKHKDQWILDVYDMVMNDEG